MIELPLQLWEPQMPADWAVTVLQVANILASLIGLTIAYLAFRGYRRNQSRPMLFIAIGFLLVLGVPFVLLPVYLLISAFTATIFAFVATGSQLAGLLSILYAIWMPA